MTVSIVSIIFGCLGPGVSNPTLRQSQMRLPVVLQSFYSICLSTCYPRNLSAPYATKEEVLWSDKGVASAVKLGIKYFSLRSSSHLQSSLF